MELEFLRNTCERELCTTKFTVAIGATNYSGASVAYIVLPGASLLGRMLQEGVYPTASPSAHALSTCAMTGLINVS